MGVYERVLSDLRSKSDEKFKALSENVINGEKSLIGVRSDDIKKIARSISPCEEEEYLSSCKFEFYEDTLIYGLVLARKPKEEFTKIYKFYLSKADSWALIDCFVPAIKFLKKDKSDFFGEIDKNIDLSDGFSLRFYLVVLMDFYLTEDMLGYVFSKCVTSDGKGYYTDMAIAWLISSAYIKFESATYDFLARKRLSKFTHNKAIQKIVDSFRVKDKEKIKKLRIK